MITWLQGKKTYITAIIVVAMIVLKDAFGFEIPDMILEGLLALGLITSKTGVKASVEKVLSTEDK
jgi:hypothetical protein